MILMKVVAILLAIGGLVLCVPRILGFLILIVASAANEDGPELSDSAKLHIYRDILLLIVGALCLWGAISLYLSYLQYPTV